MRQLIFVLLVVTQISPQTDALGLQNKKRQLERVKTYNPGVGQTYAAGTADGLKVTLLQVKGTQLIAVNPEKNFTNGDLIKIRLQTNFDGYVYVVNITPGGERRLLFPQIAARTNNTIVGQSYDIPSSKQFKFDSEPGLEVLLVIMSRTQVPFLETVLDHAELRAGKVVLPSSAVSLLDRFTGHTQRRRTSGISTQDRVTSQAGLRTRMLKLESRKEGSIVVVAPTKKSTAMRFSPGEIAVFEIQLNHY